MHLTDITRTYFERLLQIAPPEAQAWFRTNNIEVNAMLRTTISPNIIEGGFKSNVIPSEASATIDIEPFRVKTWTSSRP